MFNVFVFAKFAAPPSRSVYDADMREDSALVEYGYLFVPGFRSVIRAFLEMLRLQGFDVHRCPMVAGDAIGPVIFVASVVLPPTIIPDSETDTVVVPG